MENFDVPPRDKQDLLWGGNVTDGDICHIISGLRLSKARGGLAHFLFLDVAILQATVVMEPSSVCFHQCLVEILPPWLSMMSRQDVQNHVLLFSFRIKLSTHLFRNLCCLIVAVSHAVCDIILRSDRCQNAADDLEDSEKEHVEDIISMSSIKL